jgi:DNA polymerase III epsilon subunit family exonuclease
LNWYELGPFTVFDFETTGMSPVCDRVVELAALRIDADGEESCYHSLVDPGRPIPPEVTNIHHITDDMVRGAPRFAAVGREFLEFAEGSTLVAHNARFDLGFLQEGLARCGLPLWKGKTLDSVRLARRCFPGLASYRLQNLRVVLHLDDEEGNDQAHRAGADVFWTAQVLRRSLERALRAGAAVRRGNGADRPAE